MRGGFDIEDHEFRRRRSSRCGSERYEGGTPIDWSGDLGGLQRIGIDEVNGVADAMTEGDLGDLREGGGHLFR